MCEIVNGVGMIPLIAWLGMPGNPIGWPTDSAKQGMLAPGPFGNPPTEIGIAPRVLNMPPKAGVVQLSLPHPGSPDTLDGNGWTILGQPITGETAEADPSLSGSALSRREMGSMCVLNICG